MVRVPSSFIYFIRNSSVRARQNPNVQFRNFTVETKEGDCGGEKFDRNIVHEICMITRKKPRWEDTLLSDYASFNFSDPLFFLAYLKHQNNAFLSLRFFTWLRSHCNFFPDQSSCNALFDALVDAKACVAAKSLLDLFGFTPSPSSLERYIRCLSHGGMAEEAVYVFGKCTSVGFCPSMATWNASLSACLKIKRTDLFWTLYEQMTKSEAIASMDVETIGYLIQASCDDNKVDDGYQLLRQVLENGWCPDNVVFNTLISGFFKERQYARISELLHIMIAKRHRPDIFTYQEIIVGLLRRKKNLECFRLFNDLKERGYFPDRVMYTTIIKCLCEMKWHGEARKLWFEMIRKGLLPNEYTYNVMIHGFCQIGNFYEARKLFKEMRYKGYQQTVSYTTMISGLCLHGRTDEAQELFEEMHQKGIVRDWITYNVLIGGLRRKGKLDEAKKLCNELRSQGSYRFPLISTLIEDSVKMDTFRRQ